MRAPVDVIARTRDVAVALDPAVEAALGFRASDLVEFTLRYGDAAIRHAAAAWPIAARTGPDRALLCNDPARFTWETQSVPATVTAAEVRVARRWWSADRLGDAAFRCSGRERAVRALEWATADPQQFADWPSCVLGWCLNAFVARSVTRPVIGDS
jgi:hypothetical protein